MVQLNNELIFVTCYGVPSCCQHYQHPLGEAPRWRENIRQCTNGQCCESGFLCNLRRDCSYRISASVDISQVSMCASGSMNKK